MKGDKENVEELKILLTKDNEYFEKYVNIPKIEFYDADNLIKKEKSVDLICPICFYILKNPISCSIKKKFPFFL